MQNKGLVDTNILIYAYDSSSPRNIKAKSWLESAVKKGAVVIAWQVILEFYSIITSPKRTNNPVKPKLATKIIEDLIKNIPVIVTNKKSSEYLIRLIKNYEPVGADVFDFQLSSTALGNGVNIIYTANVKDFVKVGELKAVNPLTV